MVVLLRWVWASNVCLSCISHSLNGGIENDEWMTMPLRAIFYKKKGEAAPSVLEFSAKFKFNSQTSKGDTGHSKRLKLF